MIIFIPDLLWNKIKEYIFSEIINIKSWYYILYLRKNVIKYILIKNIPNLLTCNKKFKKVKINEKYKNFYYQYHIVWRYLRNKNGEKYMKKIKMKITSIK